jgi:TolB protein
VITTEQGETEWSPDGSRIVFVGPHPFGEEFGTDIYIVDVSGGQVLNLTHGPPFSSNRRPRWSPDGQTIAFLCSDVNNPQGFVGDICTIAADGSSLSNLTHAVASYEDLGWSPDGTKIVFSGPDPSERLFGDNDLFLMNADGSGIVRLTHSPNVEQSPVWSR